MTTLRSLTLFQEHVAKWSDCRACYLCDGRLKVVLSRGTVPCDVLFIGEAPGESENVVGLPFVGPAGQLLSHIINHSLLSKKTWAATNLVCCIPRDDDGGKTAEPEDDCVRACSPRLREFVEIANPELIVCVGALARDWLDPSYKHGIRFHRKIPMVSIIHPAAILRSNIAQRGLSIQRCVVTVRNAVEDLK